MSNVLVSNVQGVPDLERQSSPTYLGGDSDEKVFEKRGPIRIRFVDINEVSRLKSERRVVLSP